MDDDDLIDQVAGTGAAPGFDEGPLHADPDTILDRVTSHEMGDSIAAVLGEMRRAQEAAYRRDHPEEGLRERKRRLTRRLISDAATMLFVTRGFDTVKVAEVADRVGLSEKTIYNYFPTKEAMVLDNADEMVEQLATALRERAPGESITGAVVRALNADLDQFTQAPDELIAFMPAFIEMIQNTPALRAAWLELSDRLTRVAIQELAAAAGVDPRDPEPAAAGRALAGLIEVGMDSQLRHAEAGLRGQALRNAVVADVERGARLLETGLWSFNLPASARAQNQIKEATRAAEEARTQVLKAMREARAAWDEVRKQTRAAADEAHRAHHQAREQGRQAHREAIDQLRQAQREAREQMRDAQRRRGRNNR